MRIRLMIIELRKYNETRELLMKKRSTGLQAQVSYQDGDWRVSVARVAVCIEKKGTGMRTGYRGACNQRSISTQSDRKRSQEKRVGTLRNHDCWLGGWPMRWHR